MHTFEIRFARSQGLAGLFEAPANSLGWRGAGRLSIDPQGIRIAMRRGLLTLFSRASLRFSTESLTEAYREGDSLRLVFKSNDKSEVLPVWTRGGDQAAELVKLLPTLRTVELDDVTTTHHFRPDWRMVSLAVVALVVAGGAALSLHQKYSGNPGTVSSGDKSVAAPEAASNTDDQLEPAVDAAQRKPGPASVSKRDSAVLAGRVGTRDRQQPISSNSSGSVEAGDAESRTAESSARKSEVAASSRDGQGDARSTASIDAAQWLLDIFEAQSGKGIDDEGWWQFTVTLYTAPEFQQRDLWAVREAMLAVSRAWRAHDVEFAQELTWQVHMLIRQAL
jgi:hypothetical protein